MKENIITFDMSVGRQKPETMRHRQADCPFCDREHLTGIVATAGDMIFLHNKYNVMQGADQYVLIEGSDCDAEMPDYSPAHMHEVIRFGLVNWQHMLDCQRYTDVIFFKNCGPLSGGTIHHPHMQLIGLHDIDHSLLYDDSWFHGPVIDRTQRVTLNISDAPKIGFWELNITAGMPLDELLSDKPASQVSLITLADDIQHCVDYLTRHFNRGRCDSYNLFFYHPANMVRVKILPRYTTPPLYVGYNIHFRPSNLDDVINDFRALYY